MFNQLSLGLIAALFAPLTVAAQQVSDIRAAQNSGAYAQDSRAAVLRSSTGLCWRTGFWTHDDAMPGCDGDLVAPISKSIAPDLGSSNVPTVLAPPLVALSPARPCDVAVSVPGDATFAVGSSTLPLAMKKRLERQFREAVATCARIDSIVVTGHTDSIGSAVENQKLSARRAADVATFLETLSSGAKITAVGKADREPLVTCPKTSSRTALVKCLAPNRRVAIEIRGVTR
jgi:OOP family OmpA-OmpF porin